MAVAAEFFEISPRNWRARLAISVDMMRELSRYTDPDEMYHVFARRMSQLYPTSRQVSLTRRGLSAPEFRITRFNLWKERINPYRDLERLPLLAGGLLADLLYAEQPRVIDDLILEPDDPAVEYLDGQRSLLALPLYEQGVAMNVIVVTREEPAAFPREQVPELVWMTNLFGRAMQTLVLSEQLREAYDAADFELRTIANLQHSLLPAALPRVSGLELAVHYRTANRAGGDYYDFFPLPEGKLGILVADVSGHGTPASVLMAITHSLAHAYPEPPVHPGQFLAKLNDRLSHHYTTTTGYFVTAFYAVVDPVRGQLTSASAGHQPPRLATHGHWAPLPIRQGLPLGVSQQPEPYQEQTVPFGAGARLAVFTDGILEAVNRTGEPFGFERLDASLGDRTATADEVVQAVVESVDDFTAAATSTDDRTLLVVRHV